MSVTLTKPIKRGNDEITVVSITETIKQAGSLRGLRLVDVLNFDFDSIATLLSRVTSPALTTADIAAMDTQDYVVLAEEITPFLTKAAPSVPGVVATENE